MAATYDQLVTISQDNGFQQRVRYAAMTAALSVYNEASSTAGHGARAFYAIKVLNGGITDWQSVALAILTNSTIMTEASSSSPPDFAIPDTDVQFQMNSIWNALAGA